MKPVAGQIPARAGRTLARPGRTLARPEIEVVLVDRPDQPSAGGGEAPIVAVAPAIANAICHASGVRLRSMPLAPGGVVRSAR